MEAGRNQNGNNFASMLSCQTQLKALEMPNDSVSGQFLNAADEE